MQVTTSDTTNSGKGDSRRPEAKDGSYERNYNLIDWSK